MVIKAPQRNELDRIANGDLRTVRWLEELTSAANAAAEGSLPNGGTTGQALIKNSATDQDVGWGTVAGLTPVATATMLANFSGGVALPTAQNQAAVKAFLAYTAADVGAQPADAGLSSIGGAASVGSLYYLSAADTWSPVTIGANLTFSAGTLAASAGSSLTSGTALVDFGSGTSVATVSVTGQAGLLAGSPIRVWIQGDSSPDHNAYTHSRILAGRVALSVENVIAGTGFDIVAASELGLSGQVSCRWQWG